MSLRSGLPVRRFVTPLIYRTPPQTSVDAENTAALAPSGIDRGDSSELCAQVAVTCRLPAGKPDRGLDDGGAAFGAFAFQQIAGGAFRARLTGFGMSDAMARGIGRHDAREERRRRQRTAAHPSEHPAHQLPPMVRRSPQTSRFGVAAAFLLPLVA